MLRPKWFGWVCTFDLNWKRLATDYVKPDRDEASLALQAVEPFEPSVFELLVGVAFVGLLLAGEKGHEGGSDGGVEVRIGSSDANEVTPTSPA